MGCTSSKKQQAPVMRHNSKLQLPIMDMEKFLEFCESKMAGENVRFYLAVEVYEKAWRENNSREKIKNIGEDIVLRYFSDKSPSQINTLDSERKKILDSFANSTFTPDTFRLVKMEVVTTLMDSIYPAFEASLKH